MCQSIYTLRHNWQYRCDLWRPLLPLQILPIHHPSTDISTRPHRVLPVQMMGERVSAYSYVEHDNSVIFKYTLFYILYLHTNT